jgi:hypothetical protein
MATDSGRVYDLTGLCNQLYFLPDVFVKASDLSNSGEIRRKKQFESCPVTKEEQVNLMIKNKNLALRQALIFYP